MNSVVTYGYRRWRDYTMHFILALMATTLDVRVHAGNVVKIEVPHGCSANVEATNCALSVEDGVEKWPFADGELRLAKGASAKRLAASEVQLVRGVLVVQAGSKALTVKTLFSEIQIRDGAALIEAKDSSVRLTNLSGHLLYTPRGEKAAHDLPIGFTTDFAKIINTGVADTGYPHPAEIDSLIKSWAKTYRKADGERFVDDLKDFVLAWRVATRMVGPWYLDTVHREIAAQEAEEAQLARLKAQQEKENNRFRDMFRSRIFSE